MTKRNQINRTIQLFLFTGIVISLFYPKAADAWNRYAASQRIGDYTAAVKQKSSSEGLEQVYEDALQYNENLFLSGTSHIAESIPAAGNSSDGLAGKEAGDPVYESALNLSEDPLMGYLDIARIDVHLPVYHYTTDQVLAHGIGHLYGTSLPVGGTNTHAVLTGHRGVPEMELFTYLDQLEEGDVFSIQVLDHHLNYQVTGQKIVEPDQVESLSIQPGKDLVSLVTCTPYGVNTHRLIVTGTRIADDRKDAHPVLHTVKHAVNAPWFILICTAAYFLFTICALIRIWKRKGKKRRRQRHAAEET
jgi:sortase A